MKLLELVKATGPLAHYARHVRKDPVVITVGGKPTAALVPIRNAGWETVMMSNHPGFLALIGRSRARQRTRGGIRSEEMRRRLGLKPRARRTQRPKS